MVPKWNCNSRYFIFDENNNEHWIVDKGNRPEIYNVESGNTIESVDTEEELLDIITSKYSIFERLEIRKLKLNMKFSEVHYMVCEGASYGGLLVSIQKKLGNIPSFEDRELGCSPKFLMLRTNDNNIYRRSRRLGYE